ncbi:MAG: hypothetical protein ABIH86_00895 [Planctomycetota bacterium]
MPQTDPLNERAVRIAQYHFRTALYLTWLANLMPRDVQGWRPPRPLWAHPSGAPQYLLDLEAAALENDHIRRRNGLPSLVAVCAIDRLNDPDACPQALNALIVLFAGDDGAVIEARLATDDPPDSPPIAVPFPADFGIALDFD